MDGCVCVCDEFSASKKGTLAWFSIEFSVHSSFQWRNLNETQRSQNWKMNQMPSKNLISSFIKTSIIILYEARDRNRNGIARERKSQFFLGVEQINRMHHSAASKCKESNKQKWLPNNSEYLFEYFKWVWWHLMSEFVTKTLPMYYAVARSSLFYLFIFVVAFQTVSSASFCPSEYFIRFFFLLSLYMQMDSVHFMHRTRRYLFFLWLSVFLMKFFVFTSHKCLPFHSFSVSILFRLCDYRCMRYSLGRSRLPLGIIKSKLSNFKRQQLKHFCHTRSF